MFAIELMMPEVSVRTFLPVALATGTATFIGRSFLGVRPAFDVPSQLILSTATSSLQCRAAAVRGARRACAACGATGVHPRPARCREIVRASRAIPICATPSAWLAVGVMMYAFLLGTGPLSHRRRRLLDHPGHPARRAGERAAAWRCCSPASWWRPRSASARAPRAEFSRRRSSWARRWAVRSAQLRSCFAARAGHQRSGLRDGRHGGDGGRRHRRRHDRRHHDLRDDARLRHRRCR